MQAEITDLQYFWKKKIIVSYCLSVLVFLIHCTSFLKYENLPHWVKVFSDFFQRIITPVAVPLFMIIAGALFFRDYSHKLYYSKIKRRFFSLFLPFVLWNFINMSFHIVSSVFLSQYFTGRKTFEFSVQNITEGILHYKYNMPFWFVFALCIFSVCAPIFDLIMSRKAIGIGAIVVLWLLASIWNIGIPTPFFYNKTCIIYFMAGAFIGKYYFGAFSRRSTFSHYLGSLFCVLLCWIYYAMICCRVISKETLIEVPLLTIASLSVWRLFDIVSDNIKEYPFMSHAFWVYALHTNISAIVSTVFLILLPRDAVASVLNFVLTIFVSLIIIEIICIIIKKLLPGAYTLLSGGR